jgi:hypothetical protein
MPPLAALYDLRRCGDERERLWGAAPPQMHPVGVDCACIWETTCRRLLLEVRTIQVSELWEQLAGTVCCPC